MSTKKIKLLVVDDSIFMRKVIIDLLSDVPYIEIVGEAEDGEDAVKKALELRPAVITMDYKMPKLNGLEATKEIMETKDYSPGIIIFSAYTQDGIKEAFRGLRMGAIDFIAKPSGEFSPDLAETKAELVLKIKLAANAYSHTITRDLSSPPEIDTSSSAGPLEKPEVVVLGASTGGPPVLEKILKGISPDISCSILIVQHMPAKFTSVFAKLVNKETQIEVRQAQEGDILKPGVCYIAQNGKHMKVEEYLEDENDKKSKKILHLTKESKVSGYRPSIDVLMDSVALNYGSACMGIILTGMGTDGLKGSMNIHENNGYIIAQSLQSAVIESMPSAIINVGICDEVLSPKEISNKINSLCT